MATILRRNELCVLPRTEVRESAVGGPLPGFAAIAAGGFRRACDVLAQIIDVSLTVVFLLSDVVLAGSLGFMIAGQIAG